VKRKKKRRLDDATKKMVMEMTRKKKTKNPQPGITLVHRKEKVCLELEQHQGVAPEKRVDIQKRPHANN